jgi:hypothetical protein
LTLSDRGGTVRRECEPTQMPSRMAW